MTPRKTGLTRANRQSTVRNYLSLTILPFVTAFLLGPTAKSASAADLAMPGTIAKTLPNGMKLIIRELHGAPLVAVDLWVLAGSGNDNSNLGGTAHYLEHLIFKGTPTRARGEIDAAFEDLGSSLNAGTMRDAAHFSSTFASAYLATALEVLADAVRRPLLPAAEMERERSVILDEIARSRNDWQQQTVDRLWNVLYPSLEYARPIFGSPETIAKIGREEVVAFHKQQYSPEKAILVVVGNTTSDAVESLALRLFGDWAKGAVSATATPNPKALETSASTPIELPVIDKLATVAIGARLPAGLDAKSRCAADILAALLADRRMGRLPAAMRAFSTPDDVGAEIVHVRGPGILALYARTEATVASQALRTLTGEIRKVQTDPVGRDEMEIAKRRVLGSYLFEIETYGGQARRLGLSEVLGSYEAAMSYPAEINRITAKDLSEFASKILDPANRLELTLKPKGNK